MTVITDKCIVYFVALKPAYRVTDVVKMQLRPAIWLSFSCLLVPIVLSEKATKFHNILLFFTWNVLIQNGLQI